MPGKRKHDDDSPPPQPTDEEESSGEDEEEEEPDSDSGSEPEPEPELDSKDEEEEEEVEVDFREKYPGVFASIERSQIDKGSKEVLLKGIEKVEGAKLEQWESFWKKTTMKELELFSQKQHTIAEQIKEAIRYI